MIAVKLCASIAETRSQHSSKILAYFRNERIMWIAGQSEIERLEDIIDSSSRDIFTSLIAACIDEERIPDSSESCDDIPALIVGVRDDKSAEYHSLTAQKNSYYLYDELLTNNHCEIRARNISNTKDAANLIMNLLMLPKSKNIIRVYNRYCKECEITKNIKAAGYKAIEIFTLFNHNSDPTKEFQKVYGKSKVRFSLSNLHERRIVINDHLFIELDNDFDSPRSDTSDWKINAYNDGELLKWIFKKNSTFMTYDGATLKQRSNAVKRSK